MAKIFTETMAQQMNNVIIKLTASFNSAYCEQTGHMLMSYEVQNFRNSEVLTSITRLIGDNDEKTFEEECARMSRAGKVWGTHRKEEDENDN